MANGQGGLNGIEAISGVQPASTSAVEKLRSKIRITITARFHSLIIKTNF